MNLNSTRLFLHTAIQLGYIAQTEGQQLLQVFQQSSQLGQPQKIEELAMSRQLLTQYQINQISQTLQKKKSPSATTFTSLGLPGYRIVRKIGQGAMGIVYEGIQISLDRKVAIKLLSSQLTKEKEYIDRIGQEAKTLARLNHPNIVAAYDFGCHQNLYYLVMEFVDGRGLDEFLKAGKVFSSTEGLEIMVQLASALQEADQNNLIHRDIKPANIMMDQKNNVKLCDLGLAKEMDIQQNKAELTSATAAVGTPVYMSPEQCRGQKDLDIRSDIYSLGATFYHLITGQKPFDAPGVGGIFAQILAGEVPNPKMANPRIPFGVAKLIQRMMAKKREARPQTPAQLLRELTQIQKAVKASAMTQSRVSTARNSALNKSRGFTSTRIATPLAQGQTPASSSMKIAIGLAFGGCAFVALVLFFLLQGPKKTKTTKKHDRGRGSQNGTGSKTESTTGSGRPSTIKPPAISNTLSLALKEMKGEISRKKYLNVLERMTLLLNQFGGTAQEGRAKREFVRLEREILSQIHKREAPLLQFPERHHEEMKALIFLYKSMSRLGSPFFQGELQKNIKNLRLSVKRASARIDQMRVQSQYYDKVRDKILGLLRIWAFKKARELFEQAKKDSRFFKIYQVKKDLDFIIKNTVVGHQWALLWAKTLAKKHLAFPVKTKKKMVWKKIIRWDDSGDGFRIKNGNDTIHLFLYLSLPALRMAIHKYSAEKGKNIKKYPFFFLLSGDIEGGALGLPQRYSSYLALAKKKATLFVAVRLAYNTVKYVRQKNLMASYKALILLKKIFGKTSYYHKYKSRFENYFRQIIFPHFRKKGLTSFLWGDMENRADGTIKFTYQPSNPQGWTDWILGKGIYPQSRGNVTLEGLTISGLIQLKVIFQGDISMEIEVKAPPQGLSGLSVFLFDKSLMQTSREKILLGIHFTLDKFSRLNLYPSLLASKPTKKVSLPASGAIYYKHKGVVGNKIRTSLKALYLRHLPPPRQASGIYKCLFYYRRGKMGVRVKNTSFGFSLRDGDPSLQKRGTLAILTGSKTMTIQKITLVGRVDKNWLAGYLQKLATSEYKSYIKDK